MDVRIILQLVIIKAKRNPMKRLLITLALFLSVQQFSRAQYVGASITFQNFYDELSPYGSWVQSPQYGYVWAPNVGRNFVPYSSNGYWANTAYGWTWVSSYRWGWAPFHYGRWVYDDWYGWLWVPGYEWGPGWVTWGSYGGNYGWAPLGPGINISINFGWRPPSPVWWTFVPCQYFGSINWYSRRTPTPRVVNNVTIINNRYSRPRNSNTWFTGPTVREVERVTGGRVRTYEVNNVSRPNQDRISNDRLNIYRPSVSQNNSNSRPERPRNVQTMDNLRPVNRLPARDPSHSVDNSRPTRPAVENPGNNTRPSTPSRPAVTPSQPVRPSSPVSPSRPTRPTVEPSRSTRPAQPARQTNPPKRQGSGSNRPTRPTRG